MLTKPKGTYFKVIKTETPIVAMQKLGGFFKKTKQGKVWYPERLMIAQRNAIYEWVPDEKFIALSTGKTFKIIFKPNKRKAERGAN